MIRTAGRGPARLKTVDGLGRTLGDERFHPPEFDHRLFFNKDSKNPLRSSWITSKAHRIIARVSFLCSNIIINSNGVYLRPVQSITVFIVIGLCEFRRRLTGLQHPLKSTVIPHIIRG